MSWPSLKRQSKRLVSVRQLKSVGVSFFHKAPTLLLDRCNTFDDVCLKHSLFVLYTTKMTKGISFLFLLQINTHNFFPCCHVFLDEKLCVKVWLSDPKCEGVS
jgi:hypothetical protein